MNVDNELDPHLLRQFSCLGTTDRDDLVKQLQKLLAGSDVSDATATFFLEMNNWNLQAAICTYVDFESQYSPPCMKLVCNSTIGGGESVPPNTKFKNSWRIQNSGTEAWPSGVCLKHTIGVQMAECTSLPVPSLGPKETTEISIELTSPAESGVYQSTWRLMTASGFYFGDALWLVINVDVCGTLAVTQQLHQLSTSQSNDEEVQMC